MSGYKTSKFQRRGRGRALASLAAGCMVISACGSGSQQAAGEVSVEPAPTEDTGPEYGATLEEWAQDLQEGSDAGTDSSAVSGDPAVDGDSAVDGDPAVDGDSVVDGDPVVNDYPDGYEQITWEDLVPPGSSSDDIFERYADRLFELEDGSPEAEVIYAEMQAEYDSVDLVNEELDGSKINLAGFVAPLTYEDDIVVEFLLVPYFGACIHVPAPPANQTILVSVDKANGLTFDESWGAVWVAGTLEANSTATDLANASYSITDATSGVYDEYS